ncbi:MAG: PKD domain-containing protein, partial [Gammaproteobacteria bacterium]|nr:PKD domain-containing protein [Gammaproteobacteria bacterium]
MASTFTIRFKATAETGDSYQDSWQIDCALLHTWGTPPIANFSYTPKNPYTDEFVTFNASSSYDLDGFILSYFWVFGDGANGTGEVATHSYAGDGTYTVVLIVTDNDGLTNTTSTDVTVLNQPPSATFSESNNTVYTGESINFDASTSYDPDGVIVSYFWDFGDDSNASGVTTEHAYTDNGSYTVTLTITDDDAANDSVTATKTILNRPPVASFTESATTISTGETVYFNASDSYDPDGSIVSYLWSFGDGANASGLIAEYFYTDDGNYTVTLTIIDDDGAAASTSATKTVLNRPPVAVFIESISTAYNGEIISFNASNSYDSDGSIISYFWDFGDGSNATEIAVDHAYVDNGNYTVTLTVTDDDGAKTSTSSTKTILNIAPIAIFTESAETVYTGESITFNASLSYDPDGSIISYFWDFGDGSNATEIVSSHAYVDDGNFTVVLTVTDDDGVTNSSTAIKTVLNQLPVASFTESAVTVYTSESIVFNASASYDPDGVVVGYLWIFGDGSNGTGVVVSHAYADDGNYTVTLTITDDDGSTDVTFSSKTVLNQAPTALFTESAETVYTGETVTFNASASYDPDGVIVGYLWDFGDGSNASGIVVSHAYVNDGNYTVTLTISDDDGATDSTSAIKTVINQPPVAVFTESAETVYTDNSVSFNASVSYDPDGVIISYFWDFGDGSNSTAVIVEHTYVEDGNYTVVLTVVDDDGA